MTDMLAPAIILLAFALLGSWYLWPGLWAAIMMFFARRAAGLQRHDAVIDGVQWHWLEGGKGPALVLLHGFAAEGSHWLAVASKLRHRFHVLIPDLPGFGFSAPPEGLAFDVASQAGRVWAWLDRVGIEECIIAGNSMGGWIAAECAARQPHRVKALWLQDPLGVSTARLSTIMAGIERGDDNPFAVRTISDYQRLAKVMFVRPPPSVYPIMKTQARRASRLLEQLPRLQMEVLQQSVPIESLAGQLTMPVLVQWGEKDQAVDVSGAPILGSILPRVEVHIQAEVGHLPMLETPFQSASLFKQFAEKNEL